MLGKEREWLRNCIDQGEDRQHKRLGMDLVTSTYHSPTKVLVVEDNPADRKLISLSLSESPHRYNLTCAERLSEGLEKLGKQPPDVMLLDLNLPDSQGSDTFQRVIDKAPHVPILVLTGADDDHLALEAVRNGAQDYILKGQMDSHVLTRAMRYAIERHQVVMALRENRRKQLEFKDKFLSHVSHELRSPLASIFQYSEVMLDGLAGPLTPKAREYLGTVLRNAKQLNSLINDLMDTARADSGKLSIELGRLDPVELIQQLVRVFTPRARVRGLSLSARVAAGLPAVLADRCRIEQILTNLIENAFKFTEAGGEVTLHAEVFSDDPKFVKLSVADTGAGISPENLEKVFDRLYQENNAVSNRQGLGLGLAICKELADRHGGRIWAESTLGKGSQFSVLLPVFSLPKIIAPTLLHADQVRQANLLIIELFRKGKPATEEIWEMARRRSREVVERCILPDKDVMLPGIHPCKRELLFVLACADLKGAAILENRIRGQLEASSRVTAGCVFTTTCKALPSIPLEIRDAGQQMEWISRKIDEAIREASLN